jgi:hypothetical protein
METQFKEKDLPLGEFQKLGLYKDGKLNLKKEDLDAMLAGRRTGMLKLEDLKMDGFSIKQMEAKLSLSRLPDGAVSLNGHPINKEVKQHPLLGKLESEGLQFGKLASVQTERMQGDKLKKWIIEFDAETKEFVSYAPDMVQAPHKVNGETLSEKQKKAFQNGETVELSDGTRLQHRASEPKGVVSDRKALILSVLLDGGISYLLVRAIKNLADNSSAQKEEFTKGYNSALNDMKAADKKGKTTNEFLDELSQQTGKPQQSRGYGRTSSR